MGRMKRNRRRLPLLLAVMLAILPACGGGKNANEIMDDMVSMESSVESSMEVSAVSSMESFSEAGTPKTETEEEAVFPDTPSGTMTMDELLFLYEDGLLAEMADTEGLDGFLQYENIKPVETRPESLTGLYSCVLKFPVDAESGEGESREYELQLYYWKPETAEEYGHEENEIDSILLQERKTKDAVLLYQTDSGYTPTENLTEFLEKEYDMEQFLILSVPQGYTFREYTADMTSFSGWLLEEAADETKKDGTEGNEPAHSDGVEAAWYAPGGIGMATNALDVLHFREGQLTDVSLPANHSEKISEVRMITGCEVPAALVEYEFDLFTASEWEEYQKDNPQAEEEESVSRYRYVFLGKEDSNIWYVLFLNESLFTEEDAVEMVRSIRFTDTAF